MGKSMTACVYTQMYVMAYYLAEGIPVLCDIWFMMYRGCCSDILWHFLCNISDNFNVEQKYTGRFVSLKIFDCTLKIILDYVERIYM